MLSLSMKSAGWGRCWFVQPLSTTFPAPVSSTSCRFDRSHPEALPLPISSEIPDGQTWAAEYSSTCLYLHLLKFIFECSAPPAKKKIKKALQVKPTTCFFKYLFEVFVLKEWAGALLFPSTFPSQSVTFLSGPIVKSQTIVLQMLFPKIAFE